MNKLEQWPRGTDQAYNALLEGMSDKEAKEQFFERLLNDPAFFGRFARLYMDAPGAIDGFLEWAWIHRREVEK